MTQNIQFDPNYSGFFKMLEERNSVIDAAPVNPLKSEYRVNQLAAALHPTKQYLKVSAIEEHEGAKSYTLIPNTALGTQKCAFFVAGQYLSITLNIDGVTVSKPYSIRSGPMESLQKNQYVITVKRNVVGFASDYILDKWAVGTEVIASGPQGHFTYEEARDAQNVIGLAGGSGITPFYSLACAIADGIEQCNLTLLYGSRSKKEILFYNEFDELMKRCPAIKVIHVLSEDYEQGFEKGFLTAELIKKYVLQEQTYSLFICGPQAMSNFLEKEIASLGLEKKYVRHELFGEYKDPEKNDDYPKEAIGGKFDITVQIRDEVRVIPCVANETLLQAIEKAGILAPSLCRSGECGFCHSKLISGKVYIPKNADARRLADLKFNFIHPCCTFPLSEVTLKVPVM